MEVFDRATIEFLVLVVVTVIGYFVNARAAASKIAASTATTQAVQQRTSITLDQAIKRLDQETEARRLAVQQIDELRGMLAHERDEFIGYRSSTTAQIVALQTQVDYQRTEIERLNRQVTVLDAERNALQFERDKLQGERDKLQGDVAKLSEKLTTADQRLVKAEENIIELTVQRRAYEKLLELLDIRIVATVKAPPEPNHVSEP